MEPKNLKASNLRRPQRKEEEKSSLNLLPYLDRIQYCEGDFYVEAIEGHKIADDGVTYLY